MLGMEGIGQMKGGFKALMKMLDALAEVTVGNTPAGYSNPGEKKYRKVQRELKEDGWL